MTPPGWGKTMSEDTDKKNDRLRKLVDSEKAHAAEYYRRARRAEAGQLRAVEEIGKLREQLKTASTMPHFTKPEWQGLTDEEIEEFENMELGTYDLCLEIETKLQEKNGG